MLRTFHIGKIHLISAAGFFQIATTDKSATIGTGESTST